MKKWPNKFLIIICLIFLIFTFLAGAYSYKLGYIKFVKNIFSIVPAFVSGQITKSNLKKEKLEIIIKKNALNNISSKRKKILNFSASDTIIESYDNKDQFEKIKLNYKDKTVDSLLTLGGPQHGLEYKNKWPFRINIENDQTILGVKKFVLYHPKKRNYLFEWLFHKTFKKENGISLFYDFIPVSINNEYLGIYALEESFDKNMLSNNNLSDSPIIKLDMSLARNTKQINNGEFYELQILKDPLITFWQEKNLYKNNEAFKNNFILAAKNLNKFRKGLLKTNEIFNLEKLATYVALCDLFQGQHALLDNNLIFYFNPKSFLLEPISFESNSGDSVLDLSIQLSQSDKGGYLTLKRMFEDEQFIKEYINKLKYFSEKEFLDNLFSDLNFEIKKKIKILNSEFYFTSNNIKNLYNQQKFIKANINAIKGIRVFFDNKNDNKLYFHIGNIHVFPIEVIGLVNDKIEINLDKKILLFGSNNKELTNYEKIYFNIPADFQMSNNFHLDNYKIKYKILGLEEVKLENVIKENYVN